MAATSWGPPPGGEAPPGQGNYIDGSYAGPTLPAYMDAQETHGDLHLMRITGANGPLPNAPFLIRKSITQHVGAMIEGAFPEANRASYALKVRSLRQFNKLLTLKTLIDGTPVVVTEHPTLNSTRCVVSCRDVIDIPESSLLEELQEQGVKEVRRITRRAGNERENTPAMILTCCGTTRPEFMDFGFIRCRTRPYYPNPMQCFQCWAFGHTKLRCRAKAPVCGKCSQEHPINEDRSCPNESYCKECQSGDHALSSRSCPKYRKENDIQRVKVDRGLSYPAARRIVEQNSGGRTYASAVESANQTEFLRLNEKIDKLIAVVEQKDKEIIELRAALAARQAPPPQNNELAFLKTIVERQDKQIEALTQQMSAFLKMVMPAGLTSIPSTSTSVNAPTPNLLVSSEAADLPPAEKQQASTSTTDDPFLEEVFAESDESPDTSPNRTPTKDTPRPSKTHNVQNKGQPPTVQQQKTPKRPLAGGTESLLAQQLKKKKHKNALDGLAPLAKR